jgi:type IV secretory pathway VirB2 component (pilin)
MKNSKARLGKNLAVGSFTAALTVLMAQAAGATSSSGMPWETPMQTIVDSLTGPVAKGLAIICMVIAGFSWAFGEGNLKKILAIVFGISVAFAAASWGLTFFGFSGGVAF